METILAIIFRSFLFTGITVLYFSPKHTPQNNALESFDFPVIINGKLLVKPISNSILKSATYSPQLFLNSILYSVPISSFTSVSEYDPRDELKDTSKLVYFGLTRNRNSGGDQPVHRMHLGNANKLQNK